MRLLVFEGTAAEIYEVSKLLLEDAKGTANVAPILATTPAKPAMVDSTRYDAAARTATADSYKATRSHHAADINYWGGTDRPRNRHCRRQRGHFWRSSAWRMNHEDVRQNESENWNGSKNELDKAEIVDHDSGENYARDSANGEITDADDSESMRNNTSKDLAQDPARAMDCSDVTSLVRDSANGEITGTDDSESARADTSKDLAQDRARAVDCNDETSLVRDATNGEITGMDDGRASDNTSKEHNANTTEMQDNMDQPAANADEEVTSAALPRSENVESRMTVEMINSYTALVRNAPEQHICWLRDQGARRSRLGWEFPDCEAQWIVDSMSRDGIEAQLVEGRDGVG